MAISFHGSLPRSRAAKSMVTTTCAGLDDNTRDLFAASMRYMEPFWDAAAQLGCPIGVHPFSFSDMPWNVVTRLALDEDSKGRGDKGLALRQSRGVLARVGSLASLGMTEQRAPRFARDEASLPYRD